MSDAAERGDEPESGAASVGYALLMADVEAAVAGAADQIALLGRVVDQGFAGLGAMPVPLPARAGAAGTTATVSDLQRSEPSAAQAERPVLATHLSPPATEPHRVPSIEAAAEHWTSHAAEPGVAVSGTVSAPVLAGELRNASPETGKSPPLPPPPGAATVPLATHRMPAQDVAARDGRWAPDAAQSEPARPAQLAAPNAVGGGPGMAQELTSTPVPSRVDAAPSLPARQAWPFAPNARALPEGSAGRVMAEPFAPVDVAPMQGDAGSSRAPGPAGRNGAADTPAPAASGPTHGDVFLDGVRVGHWLSDTMARAVGGPARGGASFDPRLGPRWPGALQGH